MPAGEPRCLCNSWERRAESSSAPTQRITGFPSCQIPTASKAPLPHANAQRASRLFYARVLWKGVAQRLRSLDFAQPLLSPPILPSFLFPLALAGFSRVRSASRSKLSRLAVAPAFTSEAFRASPRLRVAQRESP